ncbi:MAG: Gfo/Idh/MocA family oxidoreductase [Mariniphaga sp.]|nr:Gfo/Idh/MocA family oxidoreductase [Mariniphaga sp.]MDD4227689.1 Gfo/Idh/MocA family oxidoreductase [Mariniphaga sp.]
MDNSRRTFIKKSTLGVAAMTVGGVGMSAKSYGRIIGANDRLVIAIAGLGRRLHQGGVVEPIAMKENNVHLKYFCDVMESQRTRAAEKYSGALGYTPALESDIRRIFDDKEVDILVNQMPDHWHTPGACYAVQAGKHVYLEKPTSHNPYEGELLVQFQKKYGKLIQTGNQGSSAPKITEIIQEIHQGIIGETYLAVAFYSNRRGEVPVPRKAPVPEGLNWELWQGPAPRQEYMHDTWDYNWHWYGWTWGTGETGNNAIHRLDYARRAMQVDYPERVDVAGGKYHFKEDGWTMYDTLDATLLFPENKVIKIDSKSRNRYLAYGLSTGTIVYGTKGTVVMSGTGYKLYNREGELLKEEDSGTDPSALHYANFFNAIRGKDKLNSPVDEVEKTTLWCHLANISYRLGRGFDVNCRNGQALDRHAMKLWSREYEPGWEPKL